MHPRVTGNTGRVLASRDKRVGQDSYCMECSDLITGKVYVTKGITYCGACTDNGKEDPDDY